MGHFSRLGIAPFNMSVWLNCIKFACWIRFEAHMLAPDWASLEIQRPYGLCLFRPVQNDSSTFAGNSGMVLARALAPGQYLIKTYYKMAQTCGIVLS